MVSNMDTENLDNLKGIDQEKINEQTKDEILDYLIGTREDNPINSKEKSFDSLRKEINVNQNRTSTIEKKYHRKDSSVLNLIKNTKGLLIDSTKVSIANLHFAFKLTSRLNEFELLVPVKDTFSKLHSTNIDVIKLPPGISAHVKAGIKPYEPKINDIKSKTIELTNISTQLAVKLFYQAGDFIINRFPTYKKTATSTIILLGCGLLTFFSQLTIQNSNDKNDLLSSTKLSSINWNVNGNITDKEKQELKSLISKGQIKVLPKAKMTSSKISIITSTSDVSDNTMSPDAPIMLISSNTVNHSVNNGESVLSISKKYKVSISDLISANPNADLINLKPGDKIHLPLTTDISEDSTRPSRAYSKMPRNLIASRSLSGSSRNAQFDSSRGLTMAWPVPSSNAISSKYGPRWGGFHPGIDVTAPTGTPIVATKDGVVISSGWSGGYGKCIVIDHGNGTSTRYGHASALLISAGQHVKAGQIIARVGSTGWSTGPHLHYEVLINGRHHNPMNFL